MRGFIPPQTQEEVVFCKKAFELCYKSEKLGFKSFSTFLDLRQKELFVSQFNKCSGIKLEFYAGFAGDSERCIACVYNEYDEVYTYDYPLVVLHSKIRGDDKLSHRDFLGAIMSLMIKREYIGDIIIENDECYIVCHTTMAPILRNELKKVKHSFVDFDFYDGELIYNRKISLSKSVTVASMRLDAVIGAVLNVSRNEASTMIKQGMVSVNHLLTKRSDFEIIDEDILSIRKYGKYKLCFDGGKSRKDRFFITYLKY